MVALSELLNAKEGENIEFKEAKRAFEFDELAHYASALSNGGGGKIVLGVTNARPRQIVGSSAFPQPERTRRSLIDKLHINVDFEELHAENNARVLIFMIPAHPIGQTIQYEKDGIAWWRIGDSLLKMPDAVRRRIYAEGGQDFSADICPDATFNDLDMQAIDIFRNMWFQKRGVQNLKNLSAQQLLLDCDAVTKQGVTYAALVLFGKKQALSRFLGCAEIIYEYRQTESAGPADAREEFREAYFNIYNRLWELVNDRNTKHHYQDGFFIWDIDRFNERTTREAILNAVCHRNYQQPGSIFIIQHPDRLVITSPGGFLPGITPENCCYRQATRNRRIAEILAKCGLVERAGQGMDLIYASSIREGKGLPVWNGTDDYEVKMTINGLVLDNALLLNMKKIGEETLNSFSSQDFITVNAVLCGLPLPKELQTHARHLAELGLIEKNGRNLYVLSRKYYSQQGKTGEHTRRVGLDKETNKALLLTHIRKQGALGGRMIEFQQVLPMLSRHQIKNLILELKHENKIYMLGQYKAVKWFIVNEIKTPMDHK